MSFLSENIYKYGLNYLDDYGIRLDICSAEPATYEEATTTYTAGSKVIVSGSATPGDPDGWMVIIPAITDGIVSASETVTHWAISGSAELLAASTLSGSQVVTLDNTFTLTSFNIRIPDPA